MCYVTITLLRIRLQKNKTFAFPIFLSESYSSMLNRHCLQSRFLPQPFTIGHELNLMSLASSITADRSLAVFKRYPMVV